MDHLHGRCRDIQNVEVLHQRLDDFAHFFQTTFGQLLAQGFLGRLEPALLQVGFCRQVKDLNLLLGERLDKLQEAMLARVGERDRHAFAADAPGPSDAVNVHLRRRRQIEIDHVRDVIDIESSSGDVSRHQDVGLLAAE